MSTFVFAETCVFGKQSLEPISCDPLAPVQNTEATRAPLLPKVRGEFAEFLNRGSLVHLGEFPLPTGVGVRYGQKDIWLEAFLDGVGLVTSACVRRLVPTLMLVRSGFASIARRNWPSASLYRPNLQRADPILLSASAC